MADDSTQRHDGPNHPGDSRSSPYPVSRLAPPIDLVDTARQIAEADQRVGTAVHGKLEVIARQIQALQAQAREILKEGVEAARLHRASCNFPKKIGHVYHLYRRGDGSLYFSMLSPENWRDAPPHAFEGSFRLQPDMTWAAATQNEGPGIPELRALVGVDLDPGPDAS